MGSERERWRVVAEHIGKRIAGPIDEPLEEWIEDNCGWKHCFTEACQDYAKLERERDDWEKQQTELAVANQALEAEVERLEQHLSEHDVELKKSAGRCCAAEAEVERLREALSFARAALAGRKEGKDGT